jgi:7-carboxy-7-deazaguanine synthase
MAEVDPICDEPSSLDVLSNVEQGLTRERYAARLRVLQDAPAGLLMVHEIYASIQGESTYAGLPCTFVRLTGCHLRCRWCDTPHAFTQGEAVSPGEVLDKIRSLTPKMVEITGGEPLCQPGVHDLITQIADAGYKVLLETSGSLSIRQVDPRCTVILDLKCPSSGECQANDYENLRLLKADDEVKFVVANRADFDWAVTMVRQHELHVRPVLFAPVFGELEYATLCQWIVETGLPIRFQLQIHKHIWHPQQRGV